MVRDQGEQIFFTISNQKFIGNIQPILKQYLVKLETFLLSRIIYNLFFKFKTYIMATVQKITPNLWFNDNAEDAANFMFLFLKTRK
jgi:hypothetical protein